MQRPEFDAPASEWLVYGDSLQVAGDPRGELIALAAQRGARDAYVTKHWNALLGDEVPSNLDAYELDWHYSMLRGVTIRVRAGQAEAVAPLLASPVAADLRSITLVGVTGPKLDLTPAMATILERAPAGCTSFAFVDERAANAAMLVSRDFEPDENLVTFGSFEPFLARATSLAITCADSHQLELGAFAAPNLTSFTLSSLRLAEWEDLGTMAERLNAATFGKLENFELRCVEQWNANIPLETNPYVAKYSADSDDDRYGGEADDGENEGVDWAELAGLWKTLAKQPLKRLALTSCDSKSSLFEALVAAELPALDTLDFSDASELTDDDVGFLVANRAKLPSNKLVLNGSGLDDGDVKSLEQAGWIVEHAAGTGPSWRYVVGSE